MSSLQAVELTGLIIRQWKDEKVPENISSFNVFQCVFYSVILGKRRATRGRKQEVLTKIRSCYFKLALAGMKRLNYVSGNGYVMTEYDWKKLRRCCLCVLWIVVCACTAFRRCSLFYTLCCIVLHCSTAGRSLSFSCADLMVYITSIHSFSSFSVSSITPTYLSTSLHSFALLLPTVPVPLWPPLSLRMLYRAIMVSCQLTQCWAAYHLSAGAINITDANAVFSVASVLPLVLFLHV